MIPSTMNSLIVEDTGMILADIDYIIYIVSITLIALIALSLLIVYFKYLFFNNDSAIVADSAVVADDAISAYSAYRERKINYE